MKKRIVDWFVKYRIWFFFVACVLTVFTIMYLHGSDYRYVLHINGIRKLAKDARSIGVFRIYICLASISIFSLFFAGIPYVFAGKSISKCEKLIYLITIGVLIFFMAFSMLIIGVYYV